ncbi:hypothetical protein KHP62_06905 [Rhodobacteraceae bacterium NNCM2]|nr:hypothetical protein [Coraliihabitans acroporae]
MRRAALLVIAGALAACQQTAGEGPEAEVTDPVAEAQPAPALEGLPQPQQSSDPLTAQLPPPDPSVELGTEEQRIALAAARAPMIYMAIQEDGTRPLSIIFAIDESRDGTPQDDPAIRITPSDGSCNPQTMRSYSFPSPFGDAPVFGADQILQGVQASQLPAFMAIKASETIVAMGLAEKLEDTRPQNICTRKMWEAQLANPPQQG